MAYLKRLLPIFRILGATGLLIEYEDMFPYQEPIEHLSAGNAYSKAEIRELLKAATCKISTISVRFLFFLLILKRKHFMN